MNALAIFDIDGTLTDTNAVDDACYRSAVAETLGLAESVIDWTGTPHFTDRGILDWLFALHHHRVPSERDISSARERLTELLNSAMQASPQGFAAIGGSRHVFSHLASKGWRVSIATGCWRPSALIKLRAATIEVDDALIACADDAASRADIVTASQKRAQAFYGCEFSRVVSIGDGFWDVDTATQLGLPFVGVGRGERAQRLRRAGASVVIDDYTNLPAFMAALDHAAVPGSGS